MTLPVDPQTPINTRISINPQTRVGALLDAYPGIEDTLIALVPAFAKLRNPILRRTVAKVATLDQAAKVGGVSTRFLVTKLREATGQGELEGAAAEFEQAEGVHLPEAPSWLVQARVRHHIDADAMLEKGVHPIGEIRAKAAELQPGESIRLSSSFRPEPLIDTLSRGGLAVYSSEVAPGRHETYIGRQQDQAARKS